MIPWVDQEFEGLLADLSTDEFEALRLDIEANGLREPIAVDEEGAILDGHHRFKIKPDAETYIVEGLTRARKKAFVIRSNVARRNLSPSQLEDVRKVQRVIVGELRLEGMTGEQAAAEAGVPHGTLRRWEAEDEEKRRSIVHLNNASTEEAQEPETAEEAVPEEGEAEAKPLPPPPPDSRVKIAPKHYAIILKRYEAGETQARIAADYKVTQRAISAIITKERKQRDAAATRQKKVATIVSDCGILLGDFTKKAGKQVADNSVDLILTDPPYAEESINLYRALAKFAARVLLPGSWCLAYSGQHHLPKVYEALSKHLTYGWTFAVLLTGGELRFRNLKIQNAWKPILAFYKPPLERWWDWGPDVITGGREKDEHEWQQAEAEAAHVIASLSSPGGIVCDPMCGSGTSCAAAKALERRWIGIDINAETVEKARVRLA